MLSLADGSFDGIYSSRYKGIFKSCPPSVQVNNIITNVTSHGNELFTVPSFTDSSYSYLVDMRLGVCECPAGSNGAPCKHQFILWSRKLSSTGLFLPVFSAEERQMYAKIAVGESAPLQLYEGLRDRLIPSDNNEATTSTRNPVPDVPDMTNNDLIGASNDSDIDIESHREMDEATQSLDNAFDFLKSKLLTNDPSITSGIIKFSKRLVSIPTSRLGSALHAFDNKYITSSSAKIIGTKKAKKRKISVQPEAVKRRKSDSGSRQKLSKGHSASSCIPNMSKVTGKRVHKFAFNVEKNQQVAKKSGRSMKSKTTTRVKSKQGATMPCKSEN